MNKFHFSALVLLFAPLCAAALHAGQATNIEDIKTATDAWRVECIYRDMRITQGTLHEAVLDACGKALHQ
jgi:hypothetical protein